MTGIGRLRVLAQDYKNVSNAQKYLGINVWREANLLADIADQIAREHAEDCYKMGLDHGAVSRVIMDMERHVLGHEGMEDSPVARWARELREALGRHCRDGEDETVAPAPAADGRPLREGETAWNVKTGERYVVGAFVGGCVNVSDGRGGGLQLLPSQLTHQRPDSFEWLEDDAKKDACDYFWRGKAAPCNGCPREHSDDCAVDMAIDLVRRAKKLAGVSDGD